MRSSFFNIPITHEKNRCFLCGRRLGAGATREHIFPAWLLRRFDLWYQRFTLPNGQDRQYRLIRIPACGPCNTKHLSRLENQICGAVDAGFETFVQLPEATIYQWLAKILYEIMYFDGTYFIDPADRSVGTIRTLDDLQRFGTFFDFLQSVRRPILFNSGFEPWSIFVFRTVLSENVKDNFDYADNPELLAIATRMNGIGVIASLEDNRAVVGAMSLLFEKLKDEEPVTPIQFRELAARVFYARSLLDRDPKYILIGKRPTTVMGLPPQGLSLRPLFRPWDTQTFAHFLSKFTQTPFEECFIPPDRSITYLPPYVFQGSVSAK